MIGSASFASRLFTKHGGLTPKPLIMDGFNFFKRGPNLFPLLISLGLMPIS